MNHDFARPGVPVRPRNQPLYTRAGKRALDLALGCALVPVFLPLIALLWLLVKLGGGPGVFAHERVGRDGRMFHCWKLRTMVADADQRLTVHLRTDPNAALEWALMQKLRHDPRVTRLGRVLRATSLDELPQLWNVLRGEMSLVGPRPITREELARYGAGSDAYLAQRPGVTGLWQIEGRQSGCYDQRVRLDARYGRELSLVLDLWLIVRTAVVLLRPTGR